MKNKKQNQTFFLSCTATLQACAVSYLNLKMFWPRYVHECIDKTEAAVI